MRLNEGNLVMSDVKPEGVPWLSWAKKTVIALFAGASGVLGVLVIAVTASSDGGTAITTPEWLQAAVVALTAIGGSFGVYTARNQVAPRAARPDTGWKRDQGGVVEPIITYIVIAFLVVLAVIGILVIAGVLHT